MWLSELSGFEVDLGVTERCAGRSWRRGAARGEPGWAGGDALRWCYFSAKYLVEGIDYADSIDHLAVLKVLGEDNLASGDLGAVNDKSVPV